MMKLHGIEYGSLGILLTLSLMSCRGKQSFFELIPAEKSGIDFINRVVDDNKFNILTYSYLFNGAGVGVADFNHDGRQDLFLAGNQKGSNRLYINRGDFHFEDKSTSAGIKGVADWSTGVAIADVNADGWADVYISTVTIPGMFISHNELYINQRNGKFSEEAANYGLDFRGHTTQSLFFDFDNDGDLDCFLVNHAATYEEGYKTVAARSVVDSVSGSKLLRNDNGHYLDISSAAGIYSSSIGYGLGISMGDLNNDGWMDLYVSNDFKENDYCYINNQDGSFSERSEQLFGHQSRFSMGNDIADINNDGWQDVFTLDMLSPDEKILKTSVADDDIGIYDYKRHYGFGYQFSKNCLQQNMGGACFSEIGLQAGIAATDWSWAPLFADFDNDGRKDLFISNGYRYRTNDLDFNNYIQGVHSRNQRLDLETDKFGLVSELPHGKTPDYFFLHDKGDGFSDHSVDAGFTLPSLSNGAVYADLDADGKLDLIVSRINEPLAVYRNRYATGHSLDISLQGEKGNTAGIGATLYCYSRQGIQSFTQSPVRGFMSSVSPVIHIGSGSEYIDSVCVLWPSGMGEWIDLGKGTKKILIEEKNAQPLPRHPLLANYVDKEWKERSLAPGIEVSHREDVFDDQDAQPFLLHSIASQGPKMAVGDINGDGREDFYLCAAKGQRASVFMQDDKGQFMPLKSKEIEADSLYEDTDALFFDADGDGDKDLYITSGGDEYFGHQELLLDRLYINDGKGNFQKRKDLPPLYENKSCVRASDFDKDGDLDLFVGGRVNARMYGYLPASVILQNDGHGKFSELTEQLAPGLINAGMVTDASWADYDDDGWPDLVLVGEWMPVTLFKNTKGKLARQQQDAFAYSNGLWNCMFATDLDADGDLDFLLGNWGENSKLHASKDSPLKMYLADWDQNGEQEPLLAIEKNNDYYPFLVKTDLEKRLPYLKKRFLKFSDMAGKNMAEIFGKDALNKAGLLQAFTLQSSIVWNENGKLRMEALPGFLQVAPIFTFEEMGNGNNSQFIAAGNFFAVQPYEGRYDALLPTVFSFAKEQVVLQSYFLLTGEVRDVKKIRSGNKDNLLLARNNNKLIMYEK